MRAIIFSLISLLVLSMSAPAAFAGISFVTMEGIAARVGDKSITMARYDNAVRFSFAELEKGRPPDASAESSAHVGNGSDEGTVVRATVLNQLIDEVLIEEGAREKGIRVGRVEIVEKIAELKSKFPSPKDFHTSIAEGGMTIDDLEKNIREQLVVEGMQKYFASRAVISDEEIRDFYVRNTHIFVKPRRIEIRQIKVFDRLLGEMIMTSLRSGADFREMAETYSEDEATRANGGYLGFVEPGQLQSDIEVVVFPLKEGEISPLMRAEDGYCIIQVVSRDMLSEISYEDARAKIRKFLLEERGAAELGRWLQDQRRVRNIIVNAKLRYLFNNMEDVPAVEGSALFDQYDSVPY